MQLIQTSATGLYEGSGVPTQIYGIAISSQYHDSTEGGLDYILTPSGWIQIPPPVPTFPQYEETTNNFNCVDIPLAAVNTSSSFITGTLPASPSLGDFFQFADAQRTWNTNPFVVDCNGNAIMGAVSNLSCTISGANFGLLWVAGSTGWLVLQ